MSDTYQDLIRRLRQIAERRQKQHAQTSTILDPTPPVEEYVEWKSADAIAALVKERDEVAADLEQTYVKAYERGKQDGLRDGRRQGLEDAISECERLDDCSPRYIAEQLRDRLTALITTGEQSE